MAVSAYVNIDAVMTDITKEWDKIMSSGLTPVQWLQGQLATQEQRKAFAQGLYQQMGKVRPQFHARCLQEINKDDALKTNIGCSGEAHVLTFGVHKVAGLRMSVFWRAMSDSKIKDYMDQTLAGGVGMDTVFQTVVL